jgi:hypothetical protein
MIHKCKFCQKEFAKGDKAMQIKATGEIVCKSCDAPWRKLETLIDALPGVNENILEWSEEKGTAWLQQIEEEKDPAKSGTFEITIE